MIPRLSSQLQDEISEEALRCWPEEACGFLLGPSPTEVTEVRPAKNASRQPTAHFEIDPREILALDTHLRVSEQSLIGFFHSHPFGPPSPSTEDQRHAARWPQTLWVILALQPSELGPRVSSLTKWWSTGEEPPLVLCSGRSCLPVASSHSKV
ncbi:MAG: M67 family metallopeptidase [Myxococcota bacterium]|nr:M67 family metallopeptidase [Myxococcota bacterium]